MIRTAIPSDAELIAQIYNHYVVNTVVTFEEASVSVQTMSDRINETLDENLPWLVAEDTNNQLIGYAYASKWKGRCAYRYSVEVTVYLSPDVTAKGVGTKLYEALFKELKNRSYHVAMGGISLPNPASVGLHEKFGMQKVAHFKEVGFKFDQWVDVGYWQGMIDD